MEWNHGKRPPSKVGITPCIHLVWQLCCQIKVPNTLLLFFFYWSVGEFQHLISESSGFIFYGTERYLGCLPPNMLAPMNVTGTPCVCRLKGNFLLVWRCLLVQGGVRTELEACDYSGAKHRLSLLSILFWSLRAFIIVVIISISIIVVVVFISYCHFRVII